eukprot:4526027-Prymnesium_polylepis.2
MIDVKERNGRRRSQQNVEAAGGSPPGRSASPLDSISAFSDASPPKDRRLSAKVSDTLGAVVLGKEEVTRRRSIGTERAPAEGEGGAAAAGRGAAAAQLKAHGRHIPPLWRAALLHGGHCAGALRHHHLRQLLRRPPGSVPRVRRHHDGQVPRALHPSQVGPQGARGPHQRHRQRAGLLPLRATPVCLQRLFSVDHSGSNPRPYCTSGGVAGTR